MVQIFFTVLVISILFGAEVDLFIPSFPDIQECFNLSPFAVQLTLSANFLPYAFGSLFAGSLGDKYNQRTIILYSLTVFILGSLFCVWAKYYELIVLGRFLQGLGMAGPAVIAYVLISDAYPMEKQIPLMGLLTGIVTIAMAFAPVVGSYVNLYFNWRANFVVLLALGIIAFIMAYIYVPNTKGDKTVSLSPATYLPLLHSKKLMFFIASLTATGVAYWVFIGMAPILYMDSLGVELKHFGYYQGALAFVFGTVNLLSQRIINAFGLKRIFYYSVSACFISGLVILIVAALNVKSPLIITLAMLSFSIAVVFPVQIMYPMSIMLIPGSKARVSALINGLRLIFNAIVLQAISYFYVGNFVLLGITIAALILFGVEIARRMLQNGWIPLEEAHGNGNAQVLEHTMLAH